MTEKVDQTFVREMRRKVEAELVKKEKEIVSYWRGEVDKVLKRRHQDLASQTNDLATLLARMDKRLSAI